MSRCKATAFNTIPVFRSVAYSSWFLGFKDRTYRNSQQLEYSNLHLTPWCRVLPEQLTGLQLVKKFPAFHGTRRFITALTSVRHVSLSWASPIQSTYPQPTSWRSILILSIIFSYVLLHQSTVTHTKKFSCGHISERIFIECIFLEKLTGSQMANGYADFFASEVSTRHSRQPATAPDSE